MLNVLASSGQCTTFLALVLPLVWQSSSTPHSSVVSFSDRIHMTMLSKAKTTVLGGHNKSTRKTDAVQKVTEEVRYASEPFDPQNLLHRVHQACSYAPSEVTTKSPSEDHAGSLDSTLNLQQESCAYATQEIYSPRAIRATQLTRSSRRTENTSQGTVIVRTNLYRQRETQFGLQADAASADHRRRQKERDCYESSDSEGIVRRRSMTRPVSQDDCLLGQGVNPRTGIVSPGVAAAAHDTNPTAALHTQNISASTKWRQQGNQWISLGVDEPTPSSHNSSMPNLSIPKTRKLQIPQRLRELRTDSGRETPLNLQRSAVHNRVSEMALGRMQAGRGPNASMPGSYPYSPEKQAVQQRGTASAPHTPIRRKPLASTPSRAQHTEFGNAVPKPCDQSLYMLSEHPLDDANRSVSAPSLKQTFCCPSDFNRIASEDTTDRAAKLASRKGESAFRADQSFLEPRPLMPVDHDQFRHISQPARRLNLDKELPCPPMSSGQYSQARSTSSPLTSTPPKQGTMSATRCQQTLPKPLMSQNPEASDTPASTLQAHIHCPVQRRRDHGGGSQATRGISAIPIYDNPPNMLNIMPTHRKIGGPRPMPVQPQCADRGMNSNHHPVDPFNTMFMNTDMSTHSYHNRRMHRNLNPSNSTNALSTAFGNTFSNHQLSLVPVDQTLPSPVTNQMKQSSMSRTYPRVLARPPMPLRTVGMRDIPRITGTQDAHNRMSMGTRAQSNTTGMLRTPRTNAIITGQAHQPDKLVGDKILDISTKESAGLRLQDRKHVTNESIVRKCSRCHNGFTTTMLRPLDGQAQIGLPRKLSTLSANAPEVASGPTKLILIDQAAQTLACETPGGTSLEGSSATITDVEADLRDHSICCPECCKMGCHEGCSGHKITISNLDQISQRSRPRSDSSSTLVSGSSESCTSSATEISSGKLSYIKSALKAPFRHKRSVDTLLNPDNTVQARQAHRPSTSTSVSTDSSILYSGVDGASGFFGAVAAAKRAIGFDSGNADEENGLNQFIVPKKRSKTQKRTDQCGERLDNKPSAITSMSSLAPRVVRGMTTANESRKVNDSPPCRANQSTIILDSQQRRKLSTASHSSTDTQMPAISSMSLKGIFVMVIMVPVEAMCMYVHKNPEILNFGWVLARYASTWAYVIATTSRLVLNAIYVYSKTGKVKLRKADGGNIGVTEFFRDCLRSVLYMLIFVTLIIMAGRVLRILIWPLKILYTVVKYVVCGFRQTRPF